MVLGGESIFVDLDQCHAHAVCELVVWEKNLLGIRRYVPSTWHFWAVYRLPFFTLVWNQEYHGCRVVLLVFVSACSPMLGPLLMARRSPSACYSPTPLFEGNANFGRANNPATACPYPSIWHVTPCQDTVINNREQNLGGSIAQRDFPVAVRKATVEKGKRTSH